MKILNRAVKTIYRFRCCYCRSEFEMDDNEKKQVDWEFTGEYYKERDKDLPLEERFTCNADHKFHCPICNKVSWVRRHYWRVLQIMEDGTEYPKY